MAQQEVASPVHTAGLGPACYVDQACRGTHSGSCYYPWPDLRAKPLLGVCKRHEDRLQGKLG